MENKRNYRENNNSFSQKNNNYKKNNYSEKSERGAYTPNRYSNNRYNNSNRDQNDSSSENRKSYTPNFKRNDNFRSEEGFKRNEGYKRNDDFKKNDGFRKNDGFKRDNGYKRNDNYNRNEGYRKPYKKPYGNNQSNTPSVEYAPAPATEIRLNKYIADAGICSRRNADMYISAGNVTVNGEVMTTLGYRVKPTDEVRFDGKLLSSEKKEYILLNKPKGFITTTNDEKGRKTVMDLVANATNARILPVGRLDRATTGLLLLTNDGELTKKLTHPTHGVRKIYHVILDRKLEYKDFIAIEQGLELEDGFIQVDEISYVDQKPKNEIGIKIHSGRNRIVRRIFEHLGYQVDKLDRVVFAGLTKKDLPRGHWRRLTQQEVINLRNMR
ncbi:pseudouridine synthase [Capnocytophaga leadbetteri]|jgi:pseudouridylate synthase|uniref:pseudouridine synthase n=1 Tax=Capnocytophaga leadbetteri TaxID=327575 RepID=UPI0026F29415|nr:pseudouridine synthase [Capnocytophaga leadbetteri]